jgi:hypothetical protein
MTPREKVSSERGGGKKTSMFIMKEKDLRPRKDEEPKLFQQRWMSAFPPVSSFHDFTLPEKREFHEIQPDFMKFMKCWWIS